MRSYFPSERNSADRTENKAGIITGYKTPENNMALVRGCHEVGVRAIVQNSGHIFGTLKQAKECAQLGTYLNVSAENQPTSIYPPCQAPNVPIEYIKQVGPEFYPQYAPRLVEELPVSMAIQPQRLACPDYSIEVDTFSVIIR